MLNTNYKRDIHFHRCSYADFRTIVKIKKGDKRNCSKIRQQIYNIIVNIMSLREAKKIPSFVITSLWRRSNPPLQVETKQSHKKKLKLPRRYAPHNDNVISNQDKKDV